MFTPLFAADWDALIGVATVVIPILYFLISVFAKQAKVQPPQRRQAMEGQPQGEAVQAGDPLQTEIDEFLRQAQAQREGRPVQPARQVAPTAGEPPRRPRPKRRPVTGQAKRESPRQPPPLPQSAVPVVIEVVPAERPRESLAEQLAHRQETSVFDQRTRPLSQMQQASDSEFQQHMNRVFDHELGRLKPTALGMFEAAGAAAAAVGAQAASVSAAAAQTSTAPVTIHKGASDIALFLAGRKNIRDAIILSEILRRPEDRW